MSFMIEGSMDYESKSLDLELDSTGDSSLYAHLTHLG